MRHWIPIAALPFAMLAQTPAAPPAVPNTFEKLPHRLETIQPAAQAPHNRLAVPQSPSPTFVMEGVGVSALLSGRCAIPLLRAPLPKDKTDRMVAPAPSAKATDPEFVLPAPPVCEERNP